MIVKIHWLIMWENLKFFLKDNIFKTRKHILTIFINFLTKSSYKIIGQPLFENNYCIFHQIPNIRRSRMLPFTFLPLSPHPQIQIHTTTRQTTVRCCRDWPAHVNFLISLNITFSVSFPLFSVLHLSLSLWQTQPCTPHC